MLPSESNCEDPTLLDPIMVKMKEHFRSFKLFPGKECGDELSDEVLEPNMCLELCQLLDLHIGLNLYKGE